MVDQKQRRRCVRSPRLAFSSESESRPCRRGFPQRSRATADAMAPMIDDDDSDDEVPLASRVGVKKESSTPKRASPHARPARDHTARTLFKLRSPRAILFVGDDRSSPRGTAV